MKQTLFFIALFICGQCLSQSISSLEKEVYNVVNKYKLKTTKTSVILDSALSSGSEEHTEFMVETQSLEHAEYINSKGEIIQKTSNINCTDAQVAEKILTNFLNSPSHKEILDMNIRKIGVGIVTEDSGYVWVTIRVR